MEAKLGAILRDEALPMKQRFRALFSLRNLKTDAAVDEIVACFSVGDSALLKHELAYCLGQMGNQAAIDPLISVLSDEKENAMVRHEAGEALGAIGAFQARPVLEKYRTDPIPEVAETCQLALLRLEYLEKVGSVDRSPYDSVDPTPPAEPEKSVQELKDVILDPKAPLFDRYKAMFSLRNNGSLEALGVLGEALKCPSSALFRHEIAYILGQLEAKSEPCIEQLRDRLADEAENPMVRHECAEALGAIATEEAMKILKQYRADAERVVRESCDVALDVCDYQNSADFQYAIVS
jgi:deoxyhypusine monooxygenase